jgi:hypothetical protein
MSKFIKNTENLNRLLDWLDNGAPHTYFDLSHTVINLNDEESYDGVSDDLIQAAVENGCGTVACIAGAASLMHVGLFGQVVDWELKEFGWTITQNRAVEFLGIPESVRRDADGCKYYMLPVFDPILAEVKLGREATAADAAAALRSFARCGDPCWEDLADA